MLDNVLRMCDRMCTELQAGLTEEMPTNLAIDDELLDEALRLGGHATKRATVNEALGEYIARRRRRAALAELGTFDFDPGYDYKRERARR